MSTEPTCPTDALQPNSNQLWKDLMGTKTRSSPLLEPSMMQLDLSFPTPLEPPGLTTLSTFTCCDPLPFSHKPSAPPITMDIPEDFLKNKPRPTPPSSPATGVSRLVESQSPSAEMPISPTILQHLICRAPSELQWSNLTKFRYPCQCTTQLVTGPPG